MQVFINVLTNYIIMLKLSFLQSFHIFLGLWVRITMSSCWLNSNDEGSSEILKDLFLTFNISTKTWLFFRVPEPAVRVADHWSTAVKETFLRIAGFLQSCVTTTSSWPRRRIWPQKEARLRHREDWGPRRGGRRLHPDQSRRLKDRRRGEMKKTQTDFVITKTIDAHRGWGRYDIGFPYFWKNSVIKMQLNPKWWPPLSVLTQKDWSLGKNMSSLPLDFQPCASMRKTQDFVKPKPSAGQNKLPPYAKNARCDSDNQTGSIDWQFWLKYFIISLLFYWARPISNNFKIRKCCLSLSLKMFVLNKTWINYFDYCQ